MLHPCRSFPVASPVLQARVSIPASVAAIYVVMLYQFCHSLFSLGDDRMVADLRQWNVAEFSFIAIVASNIIMFLHACPKSQHYNSFSVI